MHNWDKKHKNHCGAFEPSKQSAMPELALPTMCVWTLDDDLMYSTLVLRYSVTAGYWCMHTTLTVAQIHVKPSQSFPSATAHLSTTVMKRAMNWLKDWPSWSLAAYQKETTMGKIGSVSLHGKGTQTGIHAADCIHANIHTIIYIHSYMSNIQYIDNNITHCRMERAFRLYRP